jgi:hypothetical protein
LSQGAAYAFTQTGSGWVETAKLTASDGATNSNFGVNVAFDGNSAIVGTNGAQAAYVFVNVGGTWAQQAKLVGSDSVAGDGFGISVAISGPIALVGASSQKIGSNLYQGAAYVFSRNSGVWTQEAKLVASDGAARDMFGSVAISGTTALVGAWGKKVGANSGQGAIYVFSRSGTSWPQQAELVLSDGVQFDYFGQSIAVSGTTTIVGVSNKRVVVSGGATRSSPAAYIFTGTGATWLQQAKLMPPHANLWAFQVGSGSSPSRWNRAISACS